MGLKCKSFLSKRLAALHSCRQYVFIYFHVYCMYQKGVSVANYSKVRSLNFSVKISPSNLVSASATFFCLSFLSFALKVTATKAQLHHPLYVECPLILFVCGLSSCYKMFTILFINCNISLSFSFYLRW